MEHPIKTGRRTWYNIQSTLAGKCGNIVTQWYMELQRKKKRENQLNEYKQQADYWYKQAEILNIKTTVTWVISFNLQQHN